MMGKTLLDETSRKHTSNFEKDDLQENLGKSI